MIIDLTAIELKKALEEKTISAVDVVTAYFEHIEATDESIGAYLYLDKEGAMAKAKEIDVKRQSGQALGPLAGIPVAVKDNICTVDMPTTCASKMLESYQSPFDATVVKKLKAADAIILGKLNLDEFAMGSTTENSYFKVTRNPANPLRVPGGSSGGSAAAIASKQALLTLGSDTGGSIRQPASFCGITGLKPTYGRVSRNGLIAFASSLDQIGPMGRNAKDVALLLEVISGYDAGDSTSAKLEDETYQLEETSHIKGLKVALPMNFLEEGIDQDVKDHILKAAEHFKSLGAQITPVTMTSIEGSLPAYYLISSAEASSNLARFDGVQYGYRHESYESLEELYKKSRSHGFGKEVKRRILLGTYALSSGYYDAYYKKALKMRTIIKNEFDALFETYDIVLTPVAPTTAYPIGEKVSDPLQMYMGDIYTVPVNIAGLPAISINCGFDREGMPIGMQLIGKAFSEATLLRASDAFETLTEGGSL